jgi:geranylgeranyl diphosphate synthase, type II
VTSALGPWFAEERGAVDAALQRWLPPESDTDLVCRAMRYSVFAGGKRLRPLLALLTGEALGLTRDTVLPYACCIEMIHTYSLVHDDLPAMDNDDLRRGRATCHKVYGEATAMLAGSALLTRAFEILGLGYADLPAPRLAKLLGACARAGGIEGMVGGQSRDLDAEGRDISLDELEQVHLRKTGALISVSLTGVAHIAGIEGAPLDALGRYGDTLGVLFQIRDDLLDGEGTALELGKTPGKDAASGKATYPRLLGVEATREFMAGLVVRAEELADDLPGEIERFRQLARWVAERKT